MTALPLLVAFVAFLLFALSSEPHHQRRLGRASTRSARQVLRAGAWTCIALDLALALMFWGLVFGPIWWMGTCMLGAAASFLMINLLPPTVARRPRDDSH